MKRILWTALLAVPVIARPAQAQVCIGPVPPVQVNGGLNLKFNIYAGGGRTQLGPWYQYWPHEAHFQAPPPLGPSMPGASIMTLPPAYGRQPSQPQTQPQPWTPPAPTPIPPGGQTQRTQFLPVGYFTTGQAPSYWYGR